jgi:HEAT repeat protein
MYIHPEDAPFTRALVDSDFFTALSRVMTAAWGQSPAAVLLGVLKDPDDLYQEMAARALGELKDPTTAGPLLELLKLPSTRNKAALQLELIKALGEIRDTASVDTLLALLKDPKLWETARGYAAKALGQIGDRWAAVPLTMVLDYYLDWHFQDEVFKALVTLGDRQAIGPLAQQLAERNKRTPLLDKTLESLEQGYDKKIADTLQKLSGQNFGTDGARWVAWWKQNQ